MLHTESSSEIIVVSNREPYRDQIDADGRRHAKRCSSGVVNAVEPLLLQHGGVWVAAAAVGGSDGAAVSRTVDVPPHKPRYRVRRVSLDAADRDGYYDGFANRCLWPLCHRTAIAATFRASDFKIYERVNRRFAAIVAEEARGESPVVFVQDYHFALAPAAIRHDLPSSRIATFWHVPWPALETFERCPWDQALLEGVLGSTLIGFQTPLDRDNFVRCAERLTHADVTADAVYWKGRQIRVGVYPTSVPALAELDEQPAPPITKCRADVRKQLGLPADMTLGVGVDRLDYTKGIEEKCLAIERLLEWRPDLRRHMVFAQIAEPSRQTIAEYRHLKDHIGRTVERINARFGGGPSPIVLLNAHHDRATVLRFMRAADFCYVGSLHDGMNLVSKEFVTARDDERGVLVLSAFAGASHELRDALIVNPYDTEQVARTLAAAIDMTPLQQAYRMRRLRHIVASWSAKTWAEAILEDVTSDVDSGAKPFASHLSAAL